MVAGQGESVMGTRSAWRCSNIRRNRSCEVISAKGVSLSVQPGQNVPVNPGHSMLVRRLGAGMRLNRRGQQRRSPSTRMRREPPGGPTVRPRTRALREIAGTIPSLESVHQPATDAPIALRRSAADGGFQTPKASRTNVAGSGTICQTVPPPLCSATNRLPSGPNSKSPVTCVPAIVNPAAKERDGSVRGDPEDIAIAGGYEQVAPELSDRIEGHVQKASFVPGRSGPKGRRSCCR